MLTHGRWFSLGTPASSTTKTGRHDIVESGVKHHIPNHDCVLWRKPLVLSARQNKAIKAQNYRTNKEWLKSITILIHNTVQEEFEYTKGVIGIRISMKDRQHNWQKKKYKMTNNDLQNIHIKFKIE